MARRKKSKLRTAVFAVSCTGIFAACALVLYKFTASDAKPVMTAATIAAARQEAATGIVLVPDHKGNCDKFIIRNDTGKSSYEGTVSCGSLTPQGGGSNLPPALRGMQKTLGTQQ